MTVDLYKLDSISDYDQAIDALEDYVADLVEEFVEAPEGKAYLTAHPDMAEFVGSWINHLLYFGYAYQSVTLPRMTKQDVEVIVAELFPRKIALLDPEEATTTIPELMAFWQFLKREYKHPNATRILSFLKKIQPMFKDLMNDSSKFGVAKSFLASGIAAGFDMTTNEGLQAFQEQYNQNLQQSAEMPAALGGLDRLINNLAEAIPLPPELLQALNAAPAAGDDPTEAEPLTPAMTFEQELRTSMWQKAAAELPPLTEETIALLQQQSITEAAPGTILRDFQTLLEFVGDKGVPVSGKNHLLSQSLLADLNQQLSQPIQTDLKRPMQKSYPAINGLYLLLRASGLGQIVSKGKQHFLVLNPPILQSWNQLNPTEKYFTLLETWLIRADEEILGERRSPLNEGTKCIQFWSKIPDKGQSFSKQADQQTLSYWPELHNLALLNLFGLLELQSGKPEAGKGWRVKKIKQLPLGDALMQAIVRTFLEHGLMWESETNSTQPFGELQPALQPYFPEWKNNLAVSQSEFHSGVHVFKVSLGKAWRRIAISSKKTLFDFSRLILRSVDFDFDHLDMFTYRNAIGRTVEVHHPYAEEPPATNEVRIGDLPLSEGALMTYIFDFGDWWEFEVQLESIRAEDTRSNYAEILEQHGQPPAQYPDWDEE